MNRDQPQDGFIPPHGGYQNLRSYQKALIVFDGTVYFCKRWLPKYGDRTVDQMVQSARSGKQNIAEGSIIAATSKELEIKLTNAARGSQVELQEDYQDFLRTRGLAEWPLTHRYARRLSALVRGNPEAKYATFQRGIESDDPEIAANVLLGLSRVTAFLLKRQIAALERAFLKEGGIRERMLQARLRARERDKRNPRDKRDEGDRRD